MTTPQSTSTAANGDARVIAGTLLAAIAASSVVNAAIALLGRAAGANDDFGPLQASGSVFFTAVGVLVGAAGWAIVRNRSRDPRVLLARLVPIVVVVSFIPDLALLVSDYQPRANTAGVVALLAMHVAVTLIAVMAYRRVLPLATLPDRLPKRP